MLAPSSRTTTTMASSLKHGTNQNSYDVEGSDRRITRGVARVSAETNLTSSAITTRPPDETPCGICSKPITKKDKTVACEVCLTYYHIKCHRVSKALYDVLCDGRNRCHWFCDSCEKGASKLFQTMAAMNREHDVLKTRVNQLFDTTTSTKDELAQLKSETQISLEQLNKTTTDKCNKLNAKVETVKNEWESLQVRVKKLEDAQQITTTSDFTPMSTSNTTNFEEFKENITEMEMIRGKRNNLIIHNLPETGSIDDDIKAATALFKEEFNLYTRIKKATRMGKSQTEKPRLLKTELEDFTTKKLILSKATKLRSSEHDIYKLVYIRPDLTKKQLEESKNLRRELAEIRTKQPEKKWVIKRNKIVALANNPEDQTQVQDTTTVN